MKKLLIFSLISCFCLSLILGPQVMAQADLSDVSNLDRFQGFSPDQMDRLAENGFLVLEQNPDQAVDFQFHSIYEQNEYQRIPNFITVDTALHLYHVFFDNALKSIEEYNLMADLTDMTTEAFLKAQSLYDVSSNAELKEAAGRLLVYYAVPYSLITGEEVKLDPDLEESYQTELAKIASAEAYAKNTLTGKDLNYMQFKPRGHYAGQDNLEKYFRAMMWYGLLGFPLETETGDLDFPNASFALAASWILLDDEDQDQVDLWDRINRITAIFAGNSDDLNLSNMAQVIDNVYGDQASLAAFYDEAYKDQLAKAIADLPAPQIVGKLIMYTVGEGPEVPTDKQFRLMGQRFTLDALVMQELMEPLTRPVPTVLDVAAAAGSDLARDLACADYLDNMEEADYQARSLDLQAKQEDLPEDYWQSNLYNGWLWVLQALVNFEHEDKTDYPAFMKSQAYPYKTLNTAAGNYTELKHDTILYSKQPMAEKGGAMAPTYDYYSYVEPQLEVYNRLVWLLQYSQSQLDDYGLLDENWEIQYALNSLESTFQLFADVSEKELAGEVITEEENFQLCEIGGNLESVVSWLTSQMMVAAQSPAVIADVAQITDVGAALELATGFPDIMYVVLQRPDNGDLYLARGPVYSFYEFLEEGPPLSDQDWRGRLGLDTVEDEYASYYKLDSQNFNKDVPPQPAWVGEFKDFSPSHVALNQIEY
ncbi:MAG: DUF3160 domain-containing protein [Eubacteriales bacterium]|nr:DUF3160 domain-containing protein [Clostridiales bacterium]MDY5835570.1 DUF3160 domain-containing protein [Eubacteriales bacterium]